MMLYFATRRGTWFLLSLAGILLIANGFTKLNKNLMVLLIATKLAWLLKDSNRGEA